MTKRVPGAVYPPVKRWPARAAVERIATEEADRAGLGLADVLGAGRRRVAILSRQRTWVRILDETGCSILGLATVWGCDRRCIQRTLDRRSGR